MKILSISLTLLCACGSSGDSKDKNAPKAKITSHSSGDTLKRGDEVRFKGSGSDPNYKATELTATWLAGSKEMCREEPLSKDGTTTCGTFADDKKTEITLVIKNPKKQSGKAKVSLDISFD